MDSFWGHFILIVHVVLAAALVGVVLLQKSEGGVLGVGGGSGGFMTARGASDLLTRTTAILAACFITTSITLAILGAGTGHGTTDIEKAIAAKAAQPVKPLPIVPTVPLAK